MSKTRLSISNFEIGDARRLLSRILLFVPVLLFVAAINIDVDPAGLYRKAAGRYGMNESHIARALVMGRDVMIDHPIDHRLLQKYFIEDLTVRPDIVVLGSSHLMWLGENIFPDKKVINNFVPDAVLADYLGVFEGYAKKNLYPQRVIFLLDPQLIAFPAVSDEWVSIKEDTYGMLDRLGIHPEKFKQPLIPRALLNVFSFSYFQEAMKQLRDTHGQQDRPANGDIADGEFLFLKDGRCLAGIFSGDAEKNRGKITREFYYGKYAKFSKMKPDKGLEGILERFIRYLTGHHIQVTLCMLPLNPQLYENILESQKRPGVSDFAGFEQYYRGLAHQLNLGIIGSYDPAACGLEGKDFYDGDHIRNDVMEKMFKQNGSPCSMPGLFR